MKSKLFASFGIGALTATISLGAIQYVSASGSNTITACANKSTGTMRYITKGSCKKTEQRISWSVSSTINPSLDTSSFAKKEDVVIRTVTTQPIPESTVPNSGTITFPELTDQRPTAVDMTARSYSRRYYIPVKWAGKIEGRCPSDTPIPIAHGVYALDSKGEKYGNNGWPPFGLYTMGARASIEFRSDYVASPGMTLYVTQVCGAITTAVSE